MESSQFHAFVSKRTTLLDGTQPSIIIVNAGKISEIIRGNEDHYIGTILRKYPGIKVTDFGNLVLMPGIVDSHVHVNEPGRTEWEGFYTATLAAAAGGVTTIVDMPLNSIPPTTTVKNLTEKLHAAKDKIFVDVAFWGGVIPGNENELLPLIDSGVVGFKCFLCPSGVEEFPCVSLNYVEKALQALQNSNSVLAFHAELQDEEELNYSGDPQLYDTFLKSRPVTMEVSAIEAVCSLCTKFNVKCHIVHLSASNALDIIRAAKRNGVPLTVETCHHYLHLCAEEIPKEATHFKCCPPIREKFNQEKLWEGIQDGTIDMVVSDHSPCVPELKSGGNFTTSWGGISSLQLGLPLMWTAGKERNMSFLEISKLLSTSPAKLCGLAKKGYIQEGMDADFVIWNPEETFEIDKNQLFYKNKISPYEGKTLFGKVISTYVRGSCVYKEGIASEIPIGKLLVRSN